MAERDSAGNVPVGISVATSGRSRCQRCKEPIELGAQRVSFPGRHNSLSVAKWLHPRCFAKRCLRLDYAPSNRAKCAGSGVSIAKGEPRLLMQLRNCKGEVSSTKIYRPEAAAPFLAELFGLEACAGLTTDHIASYADEEHRSWVAAALRGAASGQPTPRREQPAAAKPKAKPRKPKAATPAKAPTATAKRESGSPETKGRGKRPRDDAAEESGGSERERDSESDVGSDGAAELVD